MAKYTVEGHEKAAWDRIPVTEKDARRVKVVEAYKGPENKSISLSAKEYAAEVGANVHTVRSYFGNALRKDAPAGTRRARVVTHRPPVLDANATLLAELGQFDTEIAEARAAIVRNQERAANLVSRKREIISNYNELLRSALATVELV